MQVIDAIILANSREPKHYDMTALTIKTLRDSVQGYVLNIILIETNTEAEEVYEDCVLIKPGIPFNPGIYINMGYEKCHGDWVMILNNDLEFTPNWWEEITKIYSANPEIKSFSPFEPNFHNSYYANWFPEGQNVFLGYDVPTRVCGWCIIHRREILEKIGGFDSKFDFYFIDNDYGKRLEFHGFTHALVKTSVVFHKLSQSHDTDFSLSGQGAMDRDGFIFKEKWKFQLEKKSPKIKLVHLLLNPRMQKDLPSEMWKSRMSKQNSSIESWRKLADRFYSYTELYSEINREYLPFETCADPGIINPSKDFQNTPPVLSYGHYGAYCAHREAILKEFNSEVDALLVVEGDVLFKPDPVDFYRELEKAVEFSFANNASLFTFGKVNYGIGSQASKIDTTVDFGNYKKIDHFLCAHCYMILRSERETIQKKLLSTGWHAWDIWLYWNYDRRVPIFSPKEKLVFEPEGISMIDYNNKNTEL